LVDPNTGVWTTDGGSDSEEVESRSSSVIMLRADAGLDESGDTVTIGVTQEKPAETSMKKGGLCKRFVIHYHQRWSSNNIDDWSDRGPWRWKTTINEGEKRYMRRHELEGQLQGKWRDVREMVELMMNIGDDVEVDQQWYMIKVRVSSDEEVWEKRWSSETIVIDNRYRRMIKGEGV
jgi:hypothetical protein